MDVVTDSSSVMGFVTQWCSPFYRLRLNRLQCFEGIPAPYDTKKRMVVPNALQVIRMTPGRRFCVLGRLSEEVGWPHSDLIKRLEVRT